MSKDDSRNAKDEFLETTKDFKVIASIISFDDDEWYQITYKGKQPTNQCYVLSPLYSENEYETFLKKIDRKYDSGYGGQQLFGIILCENNIWFDRGEYDGSEWWDRHQYPELRSFFSEDLVLKYERYMKLKQIG